MLKKILITTGDTDGIGLEITAKALSQLGPRRGYQFICFRPHNSSRKYLKIIDSRFKRITFDSYQSFLKSTKSYSSSYIIDIASSKAPTEWVFTATKLGIKKQISALVTAPLSKTESFKTHKVLGHTEVFRQFVKKDLFMYFIGEKFNTLLMTDHIPLQEISAKMNKKLVRTVLEYSKEIAERFGRPKKLALIGLNPHAGECGLLGVEEIQFFSPEIKRFNKHNEIQVDGPLVPDVAFSEKKWRKYSLFISPYHDLGLTAFKLVHGQNSGIQYTVGLPFVRTSVDHGTAKDIFMKDKANCGSMEMALRYAIKFTK